MIFVSIFHVLLQSGSDACCDTHRLKKINNAYRQEVSGNRGRPYQNLDRTLNGIWWILCTGAMWNQMPAKYGKWNSVWRTFRRWSETGMWEWLISQIEKKYDRYRIAVMLDASHIKAHQDASKCPLSI